MFNRAFTFIAVIAVSAGAFVVACTDDSSNTSTPTVFNPGGGTDSGTTPNETPDSGNSTTDGGCPNQPAGCFCGTPTTQKEWLNRCTKSAALPVNLTVKPATTADIP